MKQHQKAFAAACEFYGGRIPKGTKLARFTPKGSSRAQVIEEALAEFIGKLEAPTHLEEDGDEKLEELRRIMNDTTHGGRMHRICKVLGVRFKHLPKRIHAKRPTRRRKSV